MRDFDGKLKALHQEQGERWRDGAADKADRQVGWDGRRWPGKRRPNGRRLGYGRSAEGIPGRLRRAPVRAFFSGFDVTVATAHIGEEIFNDGSANQVPRPFVGMSRRERVDNGREVLELFRDEGRALGVFK